MAEIRLPLHIAYQTTGATAVSDVILALKATDVLARDAISLLPSLIDGLQVVGSSLNVRTLSQESPLKEAFFVALLYTFQEDLRREVPPMLEHIFSVKIDDRYDTIVTVVFLIVVFYGVGFAIDAAKKISADSRPRRMMNELVGVLAKETGKSESDIMRILDAKFDKPTAIRKLVNQSKRFFIPSQLDHNVPVLIDRSAIPTEVVAEVPFVGKAEKNQDFDRYTPYNNVVLDLHAMDKDKAATGWAAVARGISDKRLKVRVMDPLKPSEVWGQDQVVADIVIVARLTSDGFVPSEIQITSIIPRTGVYILN